MDDVLRHLPNTAWTIKIAAYGVSAVVLVYNVSFVNQRHYFGLLSIGNR